MESALAFTSLFADAVSAAHVMQNYVGPMIRLLAGLAGVLCSGYLVVGGFQYMASRGKPDEMLQAKTVIRNSIIGLVLVFASVTLSSILTNSYGTPGNGQSSAVPQLQDIQPAPSSNGLVEVVIKAVTGLLNNIVQSVAKPFLDALSFFTSQTPLMAENPSVFSLWLVTVAIADALFALVLVLLGLKVMSASVFGFEETPLKQLLPRVALIFVLLNSSIFFIDMIIELSNTLIKAMGSTTGSDNVWQVLTKVVDQSGGQGVAALLIMVAFVIVSFFLLIYYIARLVTLYIGAVLAPLVSLLWLVPGFRDFSESAMKTYLTTIFVLFIHVVILNLAASLLTGMAAGTNGAPPNTLMALAVGLATIIVLLKTQGVMMQFSYASIGPRTARKLGGEFVNGISHLSKARNITNVVPTRGSKTSPKGSGGTTTVRSNKQLTSNGQAVSTKTNRQAAGEQTSRRGTSDKAAPTGTTTPAPKVSEKPDLSKVAKVSKPMEKK